MHRSISQMEQVNCNFRWKKINDVIMLCCGEVYMCSDNHHLGKIIISNMLCWPKTDREISHCLTWCVNNYSWQSQPIIIKCASNGNCHCWANQSTLTIKTSDFSTRMNIKSAITQYNSNAVSQQFTNSQSMWSLKSHHTVQTKQTKIKDSFSKTHNPHYPHVPMPKILTITMRVLSF